MKVELERFSMKINVPSEYKEQIIRVIPENLLDWTFCLSYENLDVWQWSEEDNERV